MWKNNWHLSENVTILDRRRKKYVMSIVLSLALEKVNGYKVPADSHIFNCFRLLFWCFL